ncbi:MAG TPA: HesA/MoeB/ThiF family protein [Syntrophorhabdaceae bacterium]|nr:HesA/MoeB/ThiF family protein [Syntrophorhabdaceae bacterium]HPU29139.1 HesA/MoeB/ThiF family protein [Syntrophorhabdaceae bacterium]
MNVVLSKKELERYKRQIIIPAISKNGQKKLKKSKIFIAGFGGLGSISSQYLVAAGIGSIKIIDKDVVDISNLNRQIIHWTDDLGKEKTVSGLYKLKKLNPHCNIEAITTELNETNAFDLIGDAHIIVDATDNIKTRKILNKISIARSIPFIYGGVDSFNGMVTTFIPPDTACFDCIFPKDVKKTETVGVIGPAPGVIASIQAMEAIKIILGIEGTLKGRLLYFSGMDMEFKELIIEKNPECPTCGKKI